MKQKTFSLFISHYNRGTVRRKAIICVHETKSNGSRDEIRISSIYANTPVGQVLQAFVAANEKSGHVFISVHRSRHVKPKPNYHKVQRKLLPYLLAFYKVLHARLPI